MSKCRASLFWFFTPLLMVACGDDGTSVSVAEAQLTAEVSHSTCGTLAQTVLTVTVTNADAAETIKLLNMDVEQANGAAFWNNEELSAGGSQSYQCHNGLSFSSRPMGDHLEVTLQYEAAGKSHSVSTSALLVTEELFDNCDTAGLITDTFDCAPGPN